MTQKIFVTNETFDLIRAKQRKGESVTEAVRRIVIGECGASFTTGGSDPYGTECHLSTGHADKHEGPDPYGTEDRLVRWDGGGACAGDPLPFRDVEWIDA